MGVTRREFIVGTVGSLSVIALGLANTEDRIGGAEKNLSVEDIERMMEEAKAMWVRSGGWVYYGERNKTNRIVRWTRIGLDSMVDISECARGWRPI